LKILSVSESEEKEMKFDNRTWKSVETGGVYTDINLKVKVLQKISPYDEHCKLFIVYYDSEGKEIATDRKDKAYDIGDKRDLYPGEIIGYWFKKRDDVSSYKIWLYNDRKVNDISESKTPTRKKKGP
jgi:hypothetical protein